MAASPIATLVGFVPSSTAKPPPNQQFVPVNSIVQVQNQVSLQNEVSLPSHKSSLESNDALSSTNERLQSGTVSYPKPKNHTTKIVPLGKIL